MLLNRGRKVFFCPDMNVAQPQWLPISAGIKARKTEQKQEKLLFYKLGKENDPEDRVLSSVKLISFLCDFEEADETLQSLLEMNGKEVALLESIVSEKSDNKAICYNAVLEIKEGKYGEANEPQELEIVFNCYRQEKGIISTYVNGISFTEEIQP